jgi:hypothetical protein
MDGRDLRHVLLEAHVRIVMTGIRSVSPVADLVCDEASSQYLMNVNLVKP